MQPVIKHSTPLLVLACLLILSQGCRFESSETRALKAAKLNPLQREFEKKRWKFREKRLRAPNDIKKSQVFEEATNWTQAFGERCNWEIKDWIGKLTSMRAQEAGDKVYISIESVGSRWHIEYQTPGTFSEQNMIEKGSDVYKQVEEMQVGDLVYFSGHWVKDAKRGFKEKSYTDWGSLNRPEFVVLFSEVRKLN